MDPTKEKERQVKLQNLKNDIFERAFKLSDAKALIFLKRNQTAFTSKFPETNMAIPTNLKIGSKFFLIIEALSIKTTSKSSRMRKN